jgi:hypothetical protein
MLARAAGDFFSKTVHGSINLGSSAETVSLYVHSSIYTSKPWKYFIDN